MAEYVLIENGVITEYHGGLPASWRNISGLNLLKDDIPSLVGLGWYPVTKVSVDYNPEIERITGYNYEIYDQYVTETPRVESIPQNEIVPFEQKKSEFLSQLRSLRNDRLRESDWTQLLDCVLTEEEKSQWRLYRQALRDFPELYLYDSTVNVENVNWPSL